jgi:anti-sigma-K factor RskA
MNTRRRTIDPRTEELLADQAITGLDEQQAQELIDRLQAEATALQDEFMRTAALVQLGMLAQERQPLAQMPEQLRNRILAAAPQAAGAAPATPRSAQPTPLKPAPTPQRTAAFRLQPYTGWAVAALLALAMVVVRLDTGAADPSSQRASLLRDAADAQLSAWTTPEDPRFSGVSGDVVWSDARQAGFMRLRGMPVNDPARQQYQLWIVDPERATQPVDGGVFDIQSAAGEIVIPIQAKLGVDNPAAFAITLEQPGGVVVSAGPLLVVASSGS